MTDEMKPVEQVGSDTSVPATVTVEAAKTVELPRTIGSDAGLGKLLDGLKKRGIKNVAQFRGIAPKQPCPCGSRQEYRHCCRRRAEKAQAIIDFHFKLAAAAEAEQVRRQALDFQARSESIARHLSTAKAELEQAAQAPADEAKVDEAK